MINLFQDLPEETIETTLNMIQRNLDQIGLYGGHTIRKHTDVQVLALKTRLNAEDIIYATSFWDMEVAAAVVKSLMRRYYNPIIREWLQDTTRDVISLHGTFTKSVGYGFKKGINVLNENLKKAWISSDMACAGFLLPPSHERAYLSQSLPHHGRTVKSHTFCLLSGYSGRYHNRMSLRI